MQIYPAIVVKDDTNRPEYYKPDDFVRVRIPNFHGTQTIKPYTDSNNEEKSNIARNSELPWACISRGLDNKNFSAQQLQEGDIVYVGLENEDVSKPIILGYGSRFTYTEDAEMARNNLENGGIDPSSYGGDFGNDTYGYEPFEGANDVVKVALKEAQLGEHENPDGSNRCKYTKEYGAIQPWCAIFCWWVFKHAGMSKYYYDGGKCSYTPDLKAFYEKKNQYIEGGYKAGDLIFMNWRDGNRAWPIPQHVGIAVKDQEGDTIETVEGNTSGAGSQYNGGMVMRKTRKIGGGGPVCGGVRLGLPIQTSASTGDNESRIYKFLKSSMQYNDAACCGVLANIYAECSFNTETFTTKQGDSGGTFSYGICQWNSGKSNNGLYYSLVKERPNDYNTLSGQLLFLKSQLEANSTLNNYLKSVSNSADGAYDAAHYFAKNYERCAQWQCRAEAKNYDVDKRAKNVKGNGNVVYQYDEFDFRGKYAKKTCWPKYGNV